MLKDIYKQRSQTISDRNWVMPFGKHRGVALHEIIANEPQYIEWLQANTDLDFDSDIMDEVTRTDEQRHADALLGFRA